MKRGLMNLFMFATGAAIGSVVTWKLIKTKYEEIANTEIESVKKVYFEKMNKNIEEKEAEVEVIEEIKETLEEIKEKAENTPRVPVKPDIMEYAAKLRSENYTDYSKQEEPEKEVYTRDMDDFAYDEDPYVINPEHFGEYDDYTTESLTYWADGYLTDDNGDLIEDIDGTVGIDFDDHFGTFEEDAVHIRNERYKTDYEILEVTAKYMDTMVKHP